MDESLKQDIAPRDDTTPADDKVIRPVEARQGVVSGRVFVVLVTSVAILAVIYAIIWLTNARL